MPIGAPTWYESEKPVEFPNIDEYPTGSGSGFADPAAGSSPDTAPFVRVAPTVDFDTAQLAITDTAVLIAPQDDQRRTLQLRNYSTDDVYIARSSQALDEGRGFPLAQDDRLLLETRHEVWAVCAAGKSTVLAVLAEYERRVQ